MLVCAAARRTDGGSKVADGGADMLRAQVRRDGQRRKRPFPAARPLGRPGCDSELGLCPVR
eukprot:8155124-Pyramimonas_sp.AAC.1